MPGLVPGIHVLAPLQQKDVDGRTNPAMTNSARTPYSIGCI